jgi:hypothetical protein
VNSQEGDLALLRLHVRDFGAGVTAPASAYQPLPPVKDGVAQNAYVGHHLLYGGGLPMGRPSVLAGDVQVVDVHSGAVRALAVGHKVDALAPLAGGVAAIGDDGGRLRVTSIALRAQPFVAGRYARPGPEGQYPGHDFFAPPGHVATGLAALLVHSGEQPSSRSRDGPASIVVLQRRGLRLAEIGSVTARPDVGADTACRLSCFEGYSYSRSLFLPDRILALLGYELVEARVQRTSGGRARLRETRRVSFAPGSADYRP